MLGFLEGYRGGCAFSLVCLYSWTIYLFKRCSQIEEEKKKRMWMKIFLFGMAIISLWRVMNVFKYLSRFPKWFRIWSLGSFVFWSGIFIWTTWSCF